MQYFFWEPAVSAEFSWKKLGTFISTRKKHKCTRHYKSILIRRYFSTSSLLRAGGGLRWSYSCSRQPINNGHHAPVGKEEILIHRPTWRLISPPEWSLFFIIITPRWKSLLLWRGRLMEAGEAHCKMCSSGSREQVCCCSSSTSLFLRGSDFSSSN